MKKPLPYRWLTWLLLLGLLFSLSDCRRYNTRGISRLVRREWRELLPQARNGTGQISHTTALYQKGILADLLEFLELNEKRIYRGDESQRLYDRAMIKLMSAEFIESFKLFDAYMEMSGDDIRPWLHVGLRIGMRIILLELYFHDNAIDNAAKNMKHLLTEDEILYLLNHEAAHLFAVMPGNKIDPAAKEINEYKLRAIDHRKRITRIGREPLETLMEDLYYLEFPEWYIDELAGQDPNDDELNLVYIYYLGRREYQKAYDAAKKYGFDKTHSFGTYVRPIFLGSILEVLYRLGKYDELIAVYEQFQDNPHLLTLERTFSSGYFWVACACAQTGDYTRALSFLKQAFENTHMYNMLPYLPPQPPDGMTMSTLSLLWHIITSDAFDGFKEAGRYGEIDRLMEQELAKYSHLDWFR
jgi:tetratricopeptide (TPR) repeat protein